MKDYFNLQFVMTNRKIKEVGINPVIGYLIGLTAFVLLTEYIFQKTDFAKYLIILACISLQFKLSEKNKKDFLISTYGDKLKQKIRLIENLILCFPFVTILIYKSFFLEAGILCVCSIILASFSFYSNFNFTIPTPFSKRPFEFLVGFRKSFFIFPVAYILTIIATDADNLNLGLFSMLLIFLTSMSYYSKPEQEFYVWIHAETPRMFLQNKILNASKNAILLVVPVLISLLIFYPANFELILFLFLIGVLFLWAMILTKYSTFPEEMNLPEVITLAFCLCFPPLLLAVIPYFFKKSVNNLKSILND